MLTSREQNVEQDHSMKVGNKPFTSVAKSRYLVTTLTNQYCIHEEMQSKLNLEHACHVLVKNFFLQFLT
jgi:hypothetical protein